MRLDLRRRRRRRRLAALGLAFAVSLAVAAPATAKAPAVHPYACIEHADTTAQAQPSPLAACDEGQTAVSTSGNLDFTDAATAAAGVSLLFVTLATGVLVSTHRREAPGRLPGRVGVAGSEP